MPALELLWVCVRLEYERMCFGTMSDTTTRVKELIPEVLAQYTFNIDRLVQGDKDHPVLDVESSSWIIKQKEETDRRLGW